MLHREAPRKRGSRESEKEGEREKRTYLDRCSLSIIAWELSPALSLSYINDNDDKLFSSVLHF